jgi:hypothetical protein
MMYLAADFRTMGYTPTMKQPSKGCSPAILLPIGISTRKKIAEK